MNSDDNFTSKYDYQTDRDNHEPNLMNNLTLDDIHKKSKDEDYKNQDDLLKMIENYRTTETDMMVEGLVNKEKLVNDSDIQQFKKDSDKKKSESLDDYINDKHKKDNNDVKEDKYEYMQPKPSKYGPSYGDGSPKTEDKYEKKDYSDSEAEFKSKEEENLAKLDMLRKLGELTQKGVKLSQNYNMNSDIKQMRYEYELHKSIREKHNGIKWMSNTMLDICWGLEMLNSKTNPFDLHLDGWSNSLSQEITDYYDVFGDLYEKYFKNGRTLPPEIKLMLMFGGSAINFHMKQSFDGLKGLQGLRNALNPNDAEMLRQQAIAEKSKNNQTKSNEAYNENLRKQHEIAMQRARDLEILKQQENEYRNRLNMMNSNQYQSFNQYNQTQTDAMQKQKQLAELKARLSQQMSDTRSNLNIDPQVNKRPIPQIIKNNQQPIMRPPQLPDSLKKNFNLDKNKLDTNKIDNDDDTKSYDGSSVNFNPNMDKIIDQKLNNKNIMSSRKSTVSTLDNLSNGSSITLSSRRKKKGIKINV